MNSYKINWLPSDLLTNEVIGDRRLKGSNEFSPVSAAKEGNLYSLSGEYSVADGQSVAMNMSPVAKSIIHSVKSNTLLPISVYNSDATGSAGSVVDSVNMGLFSDDFSPATAQIIYNATPQGNLVNRGDTEINPLMVVDEKSNPSFIAKNDSGATLTVFLTVIFEEIGERIASVGLTPSTLLYSTTEMSDYG